ncbi:hypothetical protein BGX21_005371, partial [Mortierella sp. AD011]
MKFSTTIASLMIISIAVLIAEAAPVELKKKGCKCVLKACPPVRNARALLDCQTRAAILYNK